VSLGDLLWQRFSSLLAQSFFGFELLGVRVESTGMRVTLLAGMVKFWIILATVALVLFLFGMWGLLYGR
jgi:hypothetical protein